MDEKNIFIFFQGCHKCDFSLSSLFFVASNERLENERMKLHFGIETVVSEWNGSLKVLAISTLFLLLPKGTSAWQSRPAYLGGTALLTRPGFRNKH